MNFVIGLSTTIILFAGAVTGNVFEDGTHPSNNANTNQANGRRRGPLGGVTPGASAADCAKPLDIKLYADSPSEIRFRPDPRACRSGVAFAGASDDGHSHVTMVPGRGKKGGFMASVVDDVTGAVYSIQPNGNGEMEVVERLQEDYGPELDPEDIMPPSERRLLESRIAAKNSQEPAATAGLRGNVANQLKELGDNFLKENDLSHRSLLTPTVMDVLVLWTSKAECRNSNEAAGCTRGGTTENNIRGRIDLAITETNTAYTNSGVNAELNLVHAEWTNYVEAASDAFGTALSHLRGTTDGNMDDVHDMRTTYGADIVALIIDDSQYCGIAYIGPRIDLMFSVTAWNCATGYYSFGHEIGHNQGCNHDRGTSSACSNNNYNYGYRDPNASFRSILAYSCRTGQCDNIASSGCTRVGRFSNPTIPYNGSPIGNAQNDNAQQINDVKAEIAGYFDTVCVNCASDPTTSPTSKPTQPPTSQPTNVPSNSPTHEPTSSPTLPGFCSDGSGRCSDTDMEQCLCSGRRRLDDFSAAVRGGGGHRRLCEGLNGGSCNSRSDCEWIGGTGCVQSGPVTDPPSAAPITKSPTSAPSPAPTRNPTTPNPTRAPTLCSCSATAIPTWAPTSSPAGRPTPIPTNVPTPKPTSCDANGATCGNCCNGCHPKKNTCK